MRGERTEMEQYIEPESDGERIERVMREAREMMPPALAEAWLANHVALVMLGDVASVEKEWARMRADIVRTRDNHWPF